ncbi:MAG: endoribonuclease MazF [Xanthobacteraceae bacterium]|nr:endoribonuclease MazF [Xanthobacteraceae bacterium]
MAKSTPAARSATKSAKAAYCPDSGDFIWLQFNPQVGNEQALRRPALVLSPRSYNARSGLCVVCPTTNQTKGYPFEAALPDGFQVSGVVLSDQVKSLSWPLRDSTFICKAPASIVADVRAKIKALVEL